MSTRAKWSNSGLRFYDDATFEDMPVRAHALYEDFDTADFATGAISSRWSKKLVHTAGSPSVGALANAGGGVVSIAIDATNELQDSVLYFGDQRTFDVTKALSWQARVQLGVLPGVGVQMTAGVAAAWSEGPDTIAEYLRFGLRANGTLLCEIQDGVNQVSINSGITIGTTSEWHVLKIDASNAGGVIFSVDGNQVATSTTFSFAAVGASAVLQPFASVYKAGGVGVGTLNLDMVRAWSNRV